MATYLDGVLIASNSYTGSMLTAPALTGMRLGSSFYAGTNFQGEIDDVSVFNRQLTPSEIAKLAGVSVADLGGGASMAFVQIPASTFTMGSPADESNRSSSEGPQHQVSISRAFLMATTEVTQAQYKAVTEVNPSYFTGDLSRPVEQVSWFDAVNFCNALSVRLGCVPAYRNQAGATSIAVGDVVTCDWDANGYRLPTEAEWEGSYRGNSTTAYFWGGSIDGAYCWYSTNSGATTHVPGTSRPNSNRLYDMAGNVWEWCWDWYATQYESGSAADPRGPSSGSGRVYRGGSIDNGAEYCRAAWRNGVSPTYKSRWTGFRVVKNAN